MPAKKPRKNIPQFNTTFVRCELTAEDKKHFAAWVKKAERPVEDLLTEVLQSNHKVSFSFNENTDSFIVSVTGKAEDCNNANKCYTSHAKDHNTALYVALYKFHVIWPSGVWEDASEDADFG